MLKKRADLLILSEQYRNRNIPTRFPDLTPGTAAMQITDPRGVTIDNQDAFVGLTWLQTRLSTLVSCYLTTNDLSPNLDHFQEKLDKIEGTNQEMEEGIVGARDFKAKLVKEGEPNTDAREKCVSEMVARAASTSEQRCNAGIQTTWLQGNYSKHRSGDGRTNSQKR